MNNRIDFKSYNEVVRIFWHESMLSYIQNEGTRTLPFGWNFFFSNGELSKTTQFHKNCQNIFQNDAIFYQIFFTNRLVFLLCDEEFLALSNDPMSWFWLNTNLRNDTKSPQRDGFEFVFICCGSRSLQW